MEAGRGWKKQERVGLVRSKREKIRDEKACLRWRKYSRGLEALGLFQKSHSTH